MQLPWLAAVHFSNDFRLSLVIDYFIIGIEWISNPARLKLPVLINVFNIESIDVVFGNKTFLLFGPFNFGVFVGLFPQFVIEVGEGLCPVDVIHLYAVSDKLVGSWIPSLIVGQLVRRLQWIAWLSASDKLKYFGFCTLQIVVPELVIRFVGGPYQDLATGSFDIACFVDERLLVLVIETPHCGLRSLYVVDIEVELGGRDQFGFRLGFY